MEGKEKRKRVYDTLVYIKLLPRGKANITLQVYLNVKYHRMYLDYVSDHLLSESKAGRDILRSHFQVKDDQVLMDRLCYILAVKKETDPNESMSGICKQILKKFLDQAKFKPILSK